MQQLLLDDELLPSDIAGLEQEMEEITARRQACKDTIEKLMKQEDPANGIFFAHEIHEAKKNYMLLKYQHDLRVARKNRMVRADQF